MCGAWGWWPCGEWGWWPCGEWPCGVWPCGEWLCAAQYHVNVTGFRVHCWPPQHCEWAQKEQPGLQHTAPPQAKVGETH